MARTNAQEPKPIQKRLPAKLGSYFPKRGRYALLAIEGAEGVTYVVVDQANQSLEIEQQSCHLRHAEGLRWRMKERVELLNERDGRYDRDQRRYVERVTPSDASATIPRVAGEACPESGRKAA